MKRLNPATGAPFKQGEIRQDGYVFWVYKKKVKKDGFCTELWRHPDSFKRIKDSVADKKWGHRRTARGVARVLKSGAQKRAKADSADISLTVNWIEDCIELLVDQGLCVLPAAGRGHVHPLAPSLDKIDPTNRNYTVDNTQVMPTCVNYAKGNTSTAEFQDVVVPAIVKYLSSDEQWATIKSTSGLRSPKLSELPSQNPSDPKTAESQAQPQT